MPIPKRLYYLDTIRVLSMLAVFLFHCGRFFDDEDWHVKNADTTTFASVFIMVMATWIMPLFFVISGASTWFALQKKSWSRFITDRVKRIFVPLIFGCIVLALPQVYLERVSHGDYTGSFISFIPHYFDGMYGFGGNFAWMGLHLWYLLLLFVFSVILTPLFILYQHQGQVSSTGKWLQGRGIFVTGPLLVMIPGIFLDPVSIPGLRVWGGWNMVQHLLFLFLGYTAFSSGVFMQLSKRFIYAALFMAVILTSLSVYWMLSGQSAQFGSGFYALKNAIRSSSCWAWIVAVLGIGEKWLDITSKRWNRASEAVLPFYMLHQTVIIILGYFIVQGNMPVLLKYIFIALTSFTVILLIYEMLVKRIAVLRFLFGMPGRKK